MGSEFRISLDTSALFAGIWSATGGSRMILKLGEAKVVQIQVGSQVLSEIENVLRVKAPDLIGYLALLLDKSGIAIIPPASKETLNRCQTLVDHPGDAQVIADVWEGRVDYFVTLDRQHFLNNKPLRATLPFPMGTPGDFLDWFRVRITE